MSPYHSDQMSQMSHVSWIFSVVLIVSDARRPSQGQGHLLSCSGQLEILVETLLEILVETLLQTNLSQVAMLFI